MIKVYVGRRLDPSEGTLFLIKNYVLEDGKLLPYERLRHKERHSPTGMNWGYGGSGPSDMALSILWDIYLDNNCLDEDLIEKLYGVFVNDYVQYWGDNWQITEEEIKRWVKEKCKN